MALYRAFSCRRGLRGHKHFDIHNFTPPHRWIKTSSHQASRYNPIGIQMLSEELYGQIFQSAVKNTEQPNKDEDKMTKVQNHLRKFSLWGKKTPTLPDVNFKLPPLLGKNIDEHFKILAEKQVASYRTMADKITSVKLPPMPEEWRFATGWTRYTQDGMMEAVEFPDEDVLVFDVEVLVPEGQFPTMATAASNNAWYSWCSHRMVEDKFKWPQKMSLNDFINLETPKSKKDWTYRSSAWKKRLIIGHNVAFDRSFVKEQYYLLGPKTRFLDTMSLHIAMSGLNATQRILLQAKKKGSQRKEVREAEEKARKLKILPNFEWMKIGSLNNLNDVYQLHTGGDPVAKDIREVFVKGNMDMVREQFQELMTYCASDVLATHEIFTELWPAFPARFPHPVTLSGMLQMGSTFLPVNYNWVRYTEESESTYLDLNRQLKLKLMKLADEACESMNDKSYQEDPWLWDLDWTTNEMRFKKPPKKKVKAKDKEENEEKEETAEDRINRILATKELLYKKQGHKIGYPLWYRELCPKKGTPDWTPRPSLISTQARVAPKLLRLLWDGFPVHWNDTHGWGYLVPGRGDNLHDAEEETDQPQFPYSAMLEICPPPDLPKDGGQPNKIIELEALYDELMDKISTGLLGPEDNIDIMVRLKEIERQLGILSKNKKTSKELNEVSAPWYHKGNGPHNDVNIPGCWFFRIPHKNGPDCRVGNILSKEYLDKIDNQTLYSKTFGMSSKEENPLVLQKMCSYWQNNRDRINEQIVLWLGKEDLPAAVIKSPDYDEDNWYGVITPRVIQAGTVTRRAVETAWLTASNAYSDRVGSELKAIVQSPPGYHFVGADVDSQELWIAAVIGDSYFAGEHGSTAFGWMTLQGTKSEGTDLHSKTATAAGVSRDQAKVLNYARIYGAGIRGASLTLMKFNHRLSKQEATFKAHAMYKATKGKKKYAQTEDGLSRAFWSGGSESEVFNKLEDIAMSKHPRTPVLGCRISRCLEPVAVGDDYLTSRVNWVVQSSAVDYLHLMLVCMQWLFDEYEIEGRFVISIHDEVRYMVKSEDRYRAALALQITNLFTRAMFAYKLGINDLPQSVGFFSAVDIDTCLRKEPTMDCKTPSNPQGLEKGYGIPPGEALNIYQILEKNDNQLKKKSQMKSKKQGKKGKKDSKSQSVLESQYGKLTDTDVTEDKEEFVTFEEIEDLLNEEIN